MFKPKYKIKKLFKTERARREYYMKVSVERKLAASAFVREGFLYCKKLEVSGLTKPIPAGESAVTALCVSGTGVVWGATSGKKSHLFYYVPKAPNGQVFEMRTLGAETAATAIAATVDNTAVIGTASGNLYEVKGGKWTVTEGVQEWMAHYLKAKKIRSPFKKESIAALCYARGTQRLFGLTSSGAVFEYLNKKSSAKILIKLGKNGFSPVMATDDYGHLYLVSGGCLLRYNTNHNRLDKLTTPDRKLAGIVSMAIKTDGNTINADHTTLYLGSKKGELFERLTNALKAKPLGRPCKMKNLRLLTAGKNGRIYGIAGEDNDLNHLFKYDPALKKTKDLGVPLASLEEPWYGYNFGSITAGPEGEIYLGEADRIGHLFIYHPPANS